MSNITTKQSVLLKGLSKKTVVAQFDQDHASADGGAVLLKACDERLGLSASLAACLSDKRQPGKAKHSLQELFQQRMFGIACGYADANDAARLAHDPVFKLLIAVVREDADQDIETICYDDDLYAARSWSHQRRVIIKGQITYHSGRQPKENPRFLITNIKRSPRHIYEKIYCARGDAENRIKELKEGLEIDRTSCSSFLANQLRVLMTAAAYVLFQELRLKARHTCFGRAQVSTIRLH